ncbi:thiamine pyrophosphate-binding protein [Halovenus halobia]|uniref:thiamine pyrophosphate-binding protein n=1 Tax=Halovenus halobia TaxID=3396622 RepID=UPI003F57D778
MTDTTERIVEYFESSGVETVFGFPCEQMDPYYSSLADSSIRHVLARSEASAALMGDGYARASRQVAIVDGVGGPGAAYIGAGLCEADGASSPVLALTGGNDRPIRGREVIQDGDNEAILDPHTDVSYDAESGPRAVEMVQSAIRQMTSGVPGPAHVNLPGDVLDEECDVRLANTDTAYPGTRPAPESERVREILELVESAAKPVILAGEGVVRADASEELAAFAEQTQTPVVTSVNGKGAVPETEPYAVGTVGRWGFCEPANDALEAADLVVGLGTRFSDLTTVGWTLISDETDIVHVDLDPAWLGKNYDPTVAVQADIRETLNSLNSEVDPAAFTERKERIERLAAERESWREGHHDALTSDDSPVKTQRIIGELNRVIPEDGVLVSATSFAGFFSAAFYEVDRAGLGYIQARGSDGINACLPQALGVQVARPDETVVALTGDGGVGYHIADLETAAREELPLTVVVLNNDGLGSSKASQQATDAFELSTDFAEGVDYAQVARGFGCEATRIDEPDRFVDELEAAVASDQPTLLDVQVDPFTLPPIIVEN